MVEQLVSLIKQSKQMVVFTGAGMSTESGLPDFRSKDSGLWERFDPTELATVDALIHRKEQFLAFYTYRLEALLKVKPHEGHYILAEWERLGLLDAIITQNVDGFHHEAGNRNVFELHGSFRHFHCQQSNEVYSQVDFLQGHTTCVCGGTIRPNIVLFGESLPAQAFRVAEQKSEQADLFIVLGSSLTVSPANIFPMIAVENGAKLVIINHDPTPYDAYADLIIQDRSIKMILEEIQAILS